MSQIISQDAIREHLTHVDIDNIDGRILPLDCLRTDNGEWQMWLPDGKGDLHKLNGTPVESCYFSKEPAKEDDFYSYFFEFLVQRVNYERTCNLSRAVYSDIQNLAASLAKIELIFSSRESWLGTERMAATELEYIFLNCRSLFDLFQEIMAKVWLKVKLEKPLNRKDLPPSYRKMVLHGDNRLAVDEIVTKYQIPEQIASAYHETSFFFKWLRQYRDYIVHKGRDFKYVLISENGFSISIDEPPFSGMDIWCDGNILPNNLGSLKSVACHIILTTLQAIESVIIAFESVITFSPPIVPDYKIFICGPNMKYLTEMATGVKDDPWYDSADARKL